VETTENREKAKRGHPLPNSTGSRQRVENGKCRGRESTGEQNRDLLGLSTTEPKNSQKHGVTTKDRKKADVNAEARKEGNATAGPPNSMRGGEHRKRIVGIATRLGYLKIYPKQPRKRLCRPVGLGGFNLGGPQKRKTSEVRQNPKKFTKRRYPTRVPLENPPTGGGTQKCEESQTPSDPLWQRRFWGPAG